MKVKVTEAEKVLRETLASNQALLDALPDLMFILSKLNIRRSKTAN